MPYIEPPCIELIENTIEGEDRPECDNGEDQSEGFELMETDHNDSMLNAIEIEKMGVDTSYFGF